MNKKQTSNGKIAITKLDAARRQLETAVMLWFHDGDPVSIHTLVAAAYEIIFVLNKQRGGSAMIKDLKNVKPEYVKKLWKILADAENFFKHARKDPLETFFFPPAVNRIYMLDAIRTYHEMTQQQLPLFQIFLAYVAFTEPEILGDNFINLVRPVFPPDKPLELGKSEFFKHWLDTNITGDLPAI
jgi:hypothetical protein